MNQFSVPNRRKTIKKTSSGLIGKFTMKKIEFYLRALFLENISYFLFPRVPERLVHFHIEVPLIKNLIYSLMNPNEQNNLFSRNHFCFFGFEFLLI